MFSIIGSSGQVSLRRLGSILGQSRWGLAPGPVCMINPVLEKAPDFDMNLANAVTPSAVVDKAKDREAFLRMPVLFVIP